MLVHRFRSEGSQSVRLATAASAPLRLHRFWPSRTRGGDRSCHAPRLRVTRLSLQFLPQLRSLILRPFAPAAFAAFLATTASADFSPAAAVETSPGKVLYLSSRAAWLYLMRLDESRASLFLASSPPAPGLSASSCSCGRKFAYRFFQLHLAATPCGSATLIPIDCVGHLPAR